MEHTLTPEDLGKIEKEMSRIVKENSKNDFTITNKNTEKVKIPVEKKWEDNNNQDGKRVFTGKTEGNWHEVRCYFRWERCWYPYIS